MSGTGSELQSQPRPTVPVGCFYGRDGATREPMHIRCVMKVHFKAYISLYEMHALNERAYDSDFWGTETTYRGLIVDHTSFSWTHRPRYKYLAPTPNINNTCDDEWTSVAQISNRNMRGIKPYVVVFSICQITSFSLVISHTTLFF